MNIVLVAAASENNVIGKGGGIPWDLPDDFKHFHDVTQGKPIIMGRKTHESIGRVLPGRKNIVVTRQDVQIEGCDVVHSIEDAIELVKDEPEVCVIGGGEIYSLALPLTTHIDITRVHTTIPDGTAFFPEFSEEDWKEVSSERHEADENHAYAFTFYLYERR